MTTSPHNDWSAGIVFADEKNIWLYHNVREGKISISGGRIKSKVDDTDYPYSHEPLPSINVSPNKSPDQIVRDIERRLLPDYDRVMEEKCAFRNRNNHDNFVIAQRKLMGEVRAIVGGEVRDDGGRLNVSSPDMDVYGYCHDLSVAADDLTFTFRSVPREKALKMLRVWMEK